MSSNANFSYARRQAQQRVNELTADLNWNEQQAHGSLPSDAGRQLKGGRLNDDYSYTVDA